MQMAPSTGLWVLASAVVLGGVLAGVYVGFAVGVMPGLARASDGTLVETMQRINQAIVNPGFMLVFFGAPLLAVVAAVLRTSTFTVVGAVLAVATLVVTVAINVPLNNALDAAPTDTPAQLAHARAVFESVWTRGNLVRSLTGLLAVVAPTAELVRSAIAGSA
jgi:uncharacterized membrane protein